MELSNEHTSRLNMVTLKNEYIILYCVWVLGLSMPIKNIQITWILFVSGKKYH